MLRHVMVSSMADAPKNFSPPQLVATIRECLISALSDVKAYDVPSVCRRFGLADGTEREAFASKYKYVSTRVRDVSGKRVLQIAREYLTEHDNFRLAEAVQIFDENQEPLITELTRRRIMALLKTGALVTEIEELEFFQKLWPIGSIHCQTDPSDYQWRSFEEALIQHTMRNDDWDNVDVLKAVGFPAMSRHEVSRFLVALVDPMMQKPERQAQLVSGLNDLLKHDGYLLIEAGKISGSPRYRVGRQLAGAPSDEAISDTLQALTPEEIHARWEKAMERRSSDPQGAITLARTLLEDVCKWILMEAGETYQEKDDLPALYRKLSKVLKLAPDDHTEQAFRQLLGSCQQIVELLGSLRNKLGDAHSPGPKRARPLPRHAELAVNLSGTMATFLTSTWQARRGEESASR